MRGLVGRGPVAVITARNARRAPQILAARRGVPSRPESLPGTPESGQGARRRVSSVR